MVNQREPIDSAEIKSIVTNMSRKNRYTKEIIDLVESDLKYGLTVDETKSYTKRYKDVRQMRVMSMCIRNNWSDEVMELICKPGIKAGQMECLYNLYMETKDLMYVNDIYVKSNGNIGRMKNIHRKFKEEADLADTTVYIESKEAGISESVTSESVQTDDVSTEAANEEKSEEDMKIDVDEIIKNADAEKQHLFEELAEKDNQIEDIQNQFNSCLSENKKLSIEIAKLKELLAKEKEQSEKLKEPKETKEITESEDAVSETVQRSEEEIKKEEESVMDRPIQTPVGIPVYYPVNIIDVYGNVLSAAIPDRQEKKTSPFGGIFSRLLFKRKTRIDIVKLVSGSDLTADQLCLIKSAIESGLTDKQIETLVQNKLSPDRMKEVIEIAVLEKGMV